MTYIGQLLERLISLFSFYLLHSSCMYWLGRVTSFLFVCLFKPVIICRGLWAKCSAHTCEQNPRSDSGRGDPCTSPDCSLPTEMQTYAEMASLSFLVFVILSLAQQVHIFPSFTVNTISAVSYIIRWHQRKQSYVCQLGRNHPLAANVWQAAFLYIFTLSDEVSEV